MSTKPPSSVAQFTPESLEAVAYASVSDIPTQEFNDRNRLGYCVWAYLKERRGTLELAVKSSGVRSTMEEKDIVAEVRKKLGKKGILDI